MSSNVQTWRTPVTVPSGAYTSSLLTLTQTCGCAFAGVPESARLAHSATRSPEGRKIMARPTAEWSAEYHGVGRNRGGRLRHAQRTGANVADRLGAVRAGSLWM